MKEVIIGCLAFLTAFLGCYQTINLGRGDKFKVGLTSCFIAATQLSVYRLAPSVDGFWGIVSYVIGGLIGSQLAMHKKI